MAERDLSVPVLNDGLNRNQLLPEQKFLPEVYRIPKGEKRSADVPFFPGVIFIEATNRCNLLCQTCPRTHFEREPQKSLTLGEFIHIAEQFPHMKQAELHGIGEPLLNRHLPQIIRYLKGRNVRVVTNSNGTLLTPRWQRDLVESGLDDYRCSIDGARPETYARIRGADLLDKLARGLGGLVETKARLEAGNPYISIWCVATRDNLDELPEVIRLAANIGVSEVYLQRMVYFSHEPEKQRGMATNDFAIFGGNAMEADIRFQEQVISECEGLSEALGIRFRASGARDPRNSLAAARPADFAPWRACMRPWTTAYVTANGNCLPCCISPFATYDYDSLIMGNLLEQPFTEIWNNPLYKKWRADLLSTSPHKACAGCGVYWSL